MWLEVKWWLLWLCLWQEREWRSVKILVSIFLLFTYIEPRCVTKVCFIFGVSLSWQEQVTWAFTEHNNCCQLALSGQKLLPVMFFLSLPARTAATNFRRSSWVAEETDFPIAAWSQCLVLLSYLPHTSYGCGCHRMTGDQFSGPGGGVCVFDNINSKYLTKSCFQDWWPEDFCPFPHNPLWSQKALADVPWGTTQGSFGRSTQECSVTSTLEKHRLWARGSLHLWYRGYRHTL